MNHEEHLDHGTLFALSSDMLATVGFDGRLKTLNPAWESQLGYPLGELKSMPLLDLVHEDDHVDTAHALLQAACGGDGHSALVNRCRRSDGSHVHLHWRLKAVPARRLYYAAVSGAPAPAALDAQAPDANKLSQIGRLAAGVAHDFNNILAVIQACASMLGASPQLTPMDRRDVEDLQDAARRGMGLVELLIDFIRTGEDGPGAPSDLNSEVARTERLVRRLLPSGIRLEFRPGEGLAKVRIDASRLGQVLLNLVINARDALPSGGSIELRTAKVVLYASGMSQRPVEYARLSVCDTGVGMSSSVQARMFEPFYTTKGPGKGTGLGLATVRKISQDCGGFLRVSSRPGAGSTFEVFLPFSSDPGRPSARRDP